MFGIQKNKKKMGTKQSRKEMKASLINEILKQYKQKYEGTIKKI